jgi:Fe2+ or Zn2+ uptake regulation protein
VTILHYLAQNHDAADTVRGIMSWWLPPQDRNADRAIVERVLEKLAAEGFVAVTRLADGTVFYHRLASV